MYRIDLTIRLTQRKHAVNLTYMLYWQVLGRGGMHVARPHNLAPQEP